jgi:dienelactone hydrolase
MMTRIGRFVLALCAAGICLGQQAALRPGANSVPVRGVAQSVYYYPGGAGAAQRPCVLFAPGDGGWRGFAVTMARQMAAWGYDVYGLDTKQYLESFTGRTTLEESQVISDLRVLADAVRQTRRVALVGWSEGAGLMTLAAAGPLKDGYAGLITIGLGDENVLAWRFSDNLTYITKKRPNEPTYSAMSYMPRISPLPLVMLQSTKDEYVPRVEAERLFGAARDPKRLVTIAAQNHRFDGAQAEFFRQLRQALESFAESGPRP